MIYLYDDLRYAWVPRSRALLAGACWLVTFSGLHVAFYLAGVNCVTDRVSLGNPWAPLNVNEWLTDIALSIPPAIIAVLVLGIPRLTVRHFLLAWFVLGVELLIWFLLIFLLLAELLRALQEMVIFRSNFRTDPFLRFWMSHPDWLTRSLVLHDLLQGTAAYLLALISFSLPAALVGTFIFRALEAKLLIRSRLTGVAYAAMGSRVNLERSLRKWRLLVVALLFLLLVPWSGVVALLTETVHESAFLSGLAPEDPFAELRPVRHMTALFNDPSIMTEFTVSPEQVEPILKALTPARRAKCDRWSGPVGFLRITGSDGGITQVRLEGTAGQAEFYAVNGRYYCCPDRFGATHALIRACAAASKSPKP